MDTVDNSLDISYADLQTQADMIQSDLNNLAALNGGSVWVGVKSLDALVASTAKLLGQIQASLINVQGGYYAPAATRDDAVQNIQDALDEARKAVSQGNDYATNRSPDNVAQDVLGNLGQEVDAVGKKLPGSTSITVWLIAIVLILVLITVLRFS